MRDDERSEPQADAETSTPSDACENENLEPVHDESTASHPSLTEELATLIDDGRTYAEAELAFQKTRASLAGRKVGATIGLVALAVLLVHLVLVALVVGLLIALTPPFGIWGSIGLVVGGLLLLVALTLWKVKSIASGIGRLFEDKS